MVLKSIPNHSVRVYSIWPVGDVCLFDSTISEALSPHERVFVTFYIG